MKHRATPSAPAIAAGALAFLLAFGAATARAETLTFTYDEARMSIGPLEGGDVMPPGSDPAVLTASWDPATGAFTAPGSAFDLPSFTIEDVDAEPIIGLPVTVDIRASLTAIGNVAGSYDRATGALDTTSLNVRASVGAYALGFPVASCTISPIPLPLATSGELGDTGHVGDPLDPDGASVAEWASLPPATGTGQAAQYCSQVDPVIGGPGGIWLGGAAGDGSAPVTPGSQSSSQTQPANGAAAAGATACKKKKGKKSRKKRCKRPKRRR